MLRILSITLLLIFAGTAWAETRRVCHVDETTKKESCRMVKIHHKAEKVTSGSPTDPEPKKKGK